MSRNRMFAPPSSNSYSKKWLKCLCILAVFCECALAQISNTTNSNQTSTDYFEQDVLGMKRYVFLIVAFLSTIALGLLVLGCLTAIVKGIEKGKEWFREKDYAGTLESGTTDTTAIRPSRFKNTFSNYN